MKRKLIAVCCVLALMVAMTACGSQNSASAPASTQASQATEDPLAKAKEAAITELDQYLKEDKLNQYSEENQKVIKDSVEEGKKAIESATTEEDVTKAKKDVLDKLNKLKTSADEKASEEDQAAAQAVDDKIAAIGTTITTASAGAIGQARSAYDALTEDQKKEVKNYDLLTQCESLLKEVQAEEAEQKSSSTTSSTSSSSSSSTSGSSSNKKSNYDIAKGYKGKKLDDLISKIGSPSDKEISDSCATTNGKEGYVYWDGVKVMVQSQEQTSPLIIKKVEKN